MHSRAIKPGQEQDLRIRLPIYVVLIIFGRIETQTMFDVLISLSCFLRKSPLALWVKEKDFKRFVVSSSCSSLLAYLFWNICQDRDLTASWSKAPSEPSGSIDTLI